MATFVMIHGSWHGGWCFDALRPLLAAHGHAMIAPDLPGMGSSDAELAATTLAGWGDFVAGICRSAPAGPVILVGHSRGGIVISEAAERAPEAIAALVYVCAILLPDGMSRSRWSQLRPRNAAFDAIILAHPSGAATTIDRAGAPTVFAQLSPPDSVRAATARLVAEPSAPRATPLSLSDARYGSVPRHYIECLHDRAIPIADQRAMQALLPCTSVTSLATDHSPFLSAPGELAAALLAIAGGAAG